MSTAGTLFKIKDREENPHPVEILRKCGSPLIALEYADGEVAERQELEPAQQKASNSALEGREAVR